MRRNGLVILVVALLVVGAGGAYLALRSKSGHGGSGSRPGKVVLTLSRVRAVTPDTEPAESSKTEEAEAVRKVLEAYYTDGFMDLDAARATATPTAPSAFDPEASPAAAGTDRAALSLGEMAHQLDTISEGKAEASLDLFYVQGKTEVAVAQVSFSARGTLEDGRSLSVRQKATIYLAKDATGLWKILAYDAEATQDTPDSPAPASRTAGTPAVTSGAGS
ncbi:MAG: hypothetical protein WDA71_10825 [Actinomycetota bacterium]